MGDPAKSFVVDEEERFLLHNGTAQRRAELILVESRLLSGHRLKEARRVEDGVTVEFPEFAMELVGAALNAGVDDRPCRPPKLGAIVVRLHAELRERVWIGLDDLIGKSLITGPVGVV